MSALTPQLLAKDPQAVGGFLTYSGLFRGSVENVADPERRGRVQVRVPHVHGNIPTAHLPWAERVFSDGGGANAGVFSPLRGRTVAELRDGDGVWILFEGNDHHLPVVVGTWYAIPNGETEAPKESLADKGHRRRYVQKTRHGHRIELGDDPGQFEIKISTAYEETSPAPSAHIIHLRESDGGRGIHIQTAGGSVLSLQDEDPGETGIKIQKPYDTLPDLDAVGPSTYVPLPSPPQPTANGTVQSLTPVVPVGLGQKGVMLRTSGGHIVKMTESDSRITIQSKGGQQIILDDVTRTISINGGDFVNVSAEINISFSAPSFSVDADNANWSMIGGVCTFRAQSFNFIQL
jgi:hypothetical protein